MGSKINLIGRKFGKLTVIQEHKNLTKKEIAWICLCDCGKITKPILGGNLRSGHTKSCGCMREPHGKHKTRLYGVWHGIKKRCFCPTDRAFSNYGARGITVCEEWKNSFQNFYEWAMTNGYNSEHNRRECTLDRIDVNGDYCPSNCRWVDMKTQQNNRRNNVKKKE